MQFSSSFTSEQMVHKDLMCKMDKKVKIYLCISLKMIYLVKFMLQSC